MDQALDLGLMQKQRQHNFNTVGGVNERQITQASETFRQILTQAEGGGSGDLRQYLRLINNCDAGDPLLSETPLGRRLASVPLGALAPGELSQLELALNVQQLVPTSAGLPRDYRGLAELMGFSALELTARFERSHNPAKSLLDAYLLEGHLKQQAATRLDQDDRHQPPPPPPSVAHLLRLLESLERFDLIDDLLPQLVRWSQLLASNQNFWRSGLAPPDSSQNQAVVQQQQQAAPQYDAFVCHAPEDFQYARRLIEMLETHHRRLVTVDNLLPGRFEYDAIVQVIAAECRKVIVVLTPNYLRSHDCDFQTKFAQELALKAGHWNPRLIPVLCEPLEDPNALPYMLRIMSKIDMTPRPGGAGQQQQLAWQLKKLLFALDHNSGGPASFHCAQSEQSSQQRPAYELTTTTTSTMNSSSNHGTGSGPIVDLALSSTDTGSCYALSDQLQSGLSLETALSDLGAPHEPPTSHQEQQQEKFKQQQQPQLKQSMGWYRSFKQRVRSGLRSASESSSSVSPSLSSRANLLPPGDSEENLATGHSGR